MASELRQPLPPLVRRPPRKPPPYPYRTLPHRPRSFYQRLQNRTIGALSSHSLFSNANDYHSYALSNDKEFVSVHQSSINCLSFDPSENRYLLACDDHGVIALYDTETNIASDMYTDNAPISHHRSITQHRRHYAVQCCHWYPHDTGLFVTGGSDSAVSVWDTNTFAVSHTFALTTIVNDCQMSPMTGCASQSLIAVGSQDASVRLCDVSSGSHAHSLIGHREEVHCVAWSPVNEYMLATGSSDRTIRVWDIRRTGAVLLLDATNATTANINTTYVDRKELNARRNVTSHSAPVIALSFSHDGLSLVSVGMDGRMSVWQSMTGINRQFHINLGNKQRFARFDFSANDRLVYVPSGKDIIVVRISDGVIVERLAGHFDKVRSVVLNQSSVCRDLYSGGMDHSILTWQSKQFLRSRDHDEASSDDRHRDSDDDHDAVIGARWNDND